MAMQSSSCCSALRRDSPASSPSPDDVTSTMIEPYLVVHDGHVEVADLLQRVGQVGVALREARVQQDAAVVERDALLVVAQLVVDGADQQQQVRARRVGRIYLRRTGVMSKTGPGYTQCVKTIHHSDTFRLPTGSLAGLDGRPLHGRIRCGSQPQPVWVDHRNRRA